MQLTSRFLFCLRAGTGIMLFLLAAIFSTGAQATETAHQNTAFVPFKINAATPQDIAKQADDALKKELDAKHLSMLSRQDAEKLIDSAGSWPLTSEVLTKIAESTGSDYVAAGSLTQIGDQVSLDIQVFDVLAPGATHSSYRGDVSLAELNTVMHQTVTDILSYTNRNLLIASITPAGNQRIDSGAILRKITTKPGDFYDPSQLRRDLKTVFAMGYFDDVEIETTETDKGKAIIFKVQEKPVISKIMISGTDKIEEKDVRDALSINPNTIVNPTRLKEAVQRIVALYKSKGYYNTNVTYALSYPSKGHVEVHFSVKEGEKIYIGSISFKGNAAYDDSDLEGVIQTATRGWLSWLTDTGVLKMDVLNQDAARIATFYHNNGFIEAKVGEPLVTQNNDELSITFSIEEGSRFRVGTVDIQGDLIESKDTLFSLLKIRDEKFLDRKVLRDDVLKLTDLYAEHGYAYAEIKPKVDRTPDSKRIDITLNVDKGPLVHFNRVEIEGNTRTHDNVIRRDLTVQEGGLFDSKAIRKSTKNLQRLNFFDEVTVTPKPTINEDQMNVMVNVKEKSTGQFSLGGGYSSSDGLMFMSEISENNLLGTGNRLSLAANLSGVSSRFNLSFTNPRIFDSRVLAGIDLFNWSHDYDDYTKDSWGGGLRFGQPFFEKWRISYGYSYSDTTLSNVAANASTIIKQSENINITSALQVSLTRDTRDSYISASSGSVNVLSVRHAGDPLGGDAEFTKVEASTSWFFPVYKKLVFHIKGAAGQAFTNNDLKLPVYEHFYLGGLSSIRGFKSSRISPLDPVTQERIGGDKMWYSNIEFIFPLIEDAGLNGVIFTDFGNVYATWDNWDFGTIKKSAGIGFRWLSPMGPLRLAWGYNLDKQPGEDSSVWDFSIGGAF